MIDVGTGLALLGLGIAVWSAWKSSGAFSLLQQEHKAIIKHVEHHGCRLRELK